MAEKQIYRVHGTTPLVGVSMRRLRQPGTGDVHDALSQDWGRFLATAGIAWLPLPNRGAESLALAQAAGCSGFIFTGGGDVGSEPERDATEGSLLHYARKQCLPVLGVCRGFQALQWHLGGELMPVHGHVATRHSVQPVASAPQVLRQLLRQRVVNSFHNLGIADLVPELRTLAFSADAAGRPSVEAACGAHLLGLMWHPERERVPQMADVTLVRLFFESGGAWA